MKLCAVVTGGAGFIGSHVVDRLLEDGWKVIVVDDLSTGRMENLAGDAWFSDLDVACDFAARAIASWEPDVIFHLAALTDVTESFLRPVEYATTNVVGTANIVQAAMSAGARVVFASTGGAIYGECPHPVHEAYWPQPTSPYAASKLAAEDFLLAHGRNVERGPVVLRYANVYGQRQRATLEGGVVAVFLDHLRNEREATIYGDGLQTRDFVHVADVVDATVRAVSLGGGIYNVGTGVETRIIDLATKLGLPVNFASPRSREIRRSVLDSTRLRDALPGWEPRPLEIAA